MRELIRFLPQLVLLAGQPFELSLEFLFFDLRTVGGEVALLPIERVLSSRELANLVQRILLRLFLPLFSGGGRFVVGLVALAQLLIKQRRKIRLGPVHSATAATLLLSRHLTPLVLGLGFE